MRYGKGLSGIIGSTLTALLPFELCPSASLNSSRMNDLETMQDGQVQRVVTCHKEK